MKAYFVKTVAREAYLVGEKSVWLMAYSWSNDAPLHSEPYAIGYMPYALFFGRETNDASRLLGEQHVTRCPCLAYSPDDRLTGLTQASSLAPFSCSHSPHGVAYDRA